MISGWKTDFSGYFVDPIQVSNYQFFTYGANWEASYKLDMNNQRLPQKRLSNISVSGNWLVVYCTLEFHVRCYYNDGTMKDEKEIITRYGDNMNGTTEVSVGEFDKEVESIEIYFKGTQLRQNTCNISVQNITLRYE